MAFLQIHDLDIYYRESGSGPPLILLMGFTANSDWWPEAFLKPLAEQFRVICLDNRGSGRTPPGRKSFSMRQAAADTIAFMDALEIQQAHVFGISMGGMIAQQMAISYPHRINRLILGCTMARPRTGFFSGLPGQARLLTQYVSDKAVRQRSWVVNIMFSRAFLDANPQIPGEFSAMVSQARIKPRAWLNQLLAILRFNALPHLARIQLRTLVIAGDRDLLISSKQSIRLKKRLPNTHFVMLPGLGHGFVGEQPVKIANIVSEFLNCQKNP